MEGMSRGIEYHVNQGLALGVQCALCTAHCALRLRILHSPMHRGLISYECLFFSSEYSNVCLPSVNVAIAHSAVPLFEVLIDHLKLDFLPSENHHVS
jgi:hypothetical protein